jgi:hypothetical protein
MIENQFNEVWKPYRREQDKWKPSQKYEVSNYGRVKSLKMKTPRIMKTASTGGFPVITGVRCTDEKSRSFYVHHAVAELFLPPKTEEQYRIIHLDYDKTNNLYSNLRWVNKEEWWAHQKKNPKVIKSKRTRYKLDEATVAIIKKKLFDPNRKTRIKMIAKRFGVSEMQLHRIKTGENWGYVKPAK